MSDALLNAIKAGDVDRLAGLLAAGADPNAIVISRYYTLEERLTALFFAVRELQPPSNEEPGRSIDLVVLLIRYGADVNRWDEGHRFTPISAAAQNNHIDAARILLAAGADPNVRDEEGYSPLRICAENGFVEIARLLLHCGAGKTIHEPGGGGQGANALGFAVRELHVDMVRLLLAYGADPYVNDMDDEPTPIDMLKYVSKWDEPDAQERFEEICRLLGADPSTVPIERPTASGSGDHGSS